MDAGQEHEWHIELDDMRARLRYALDNLDYLRHQIEQVRSRLNELCELTKGDTQ